MAGKRLYATAAIGLTTILVLTSDRLDRRSRSQLELGFAAGRLASSQR
jgi:hypothetical protein